MNTASETMFLSVNDYLASEEQGGVRREYLAGMVYAMAGESDAHNTIAGNISAELRSHLRGSLCRVFIIDVKARLFVAERDVFYYPDVMVACDARDPDPYFKRYPKVLVEVLSEITERTDRHEKFWNYTQVESLETYVLAAQDKMKVTIFRRSKNWRPEILKSADQELALPSLKLKLPLSAIYEGVEFKP
jgi:Uma2 family endonuclease